MCFKCQKPYFGGMKDCLIGANEKVAFNPEDLVCGVCVAETLGGMANCEKHGSDYIEYKCRFCCSTAQWFCFGTTHFCEPCHNKRMDLKGKDACPVCPGEKDCPLKMVHPPNGTDDFSCGCSLCRDLAGHAKDY